MLIEVRHWTEDLQVGDLTYYRGTLLKVTRRRESKDGHKRVVKFRKIGRVKLTEYNEIEADKEWARKQPHTAG